MGKKYKHKPKSLDTATRISEAAEKTFSSSDFTTIWTDTIMDAADVSISPVGVSSRYGSTDMQVQHIMNMLRDSRNHITTVTRTQDAVIVAGHEDYVDDGIITGVLTGLRNKLLNSLDTLVTDEQKIITRQETEHISEVYLYTSKELQAMLTVLIKHMKG